MLSGKLFRNIANKERPPEHSSFPTDVKSEKRNRKRIFLRFLFSYTLLYI